MQVTTERFKPGMRADGECPHHSDQPFYHCPECSKARRQGVGARIADEVAVTAPSDSSDSTQALVADPTPVHITNRALEHLAAAIRAFRRDRIEGRVQVVRQRVDSLPDAPDPEAVVSQKHLAELERQADVAGAEVDEFDVVVLVYLDITGVSGIHPKIRLAEPAKLGDYSQDYREYSYTGGVRVGVELQHMNYLRGLIIDWHDRLGRSGFVIDHIEGEWSMKDR